MTLPQLLIKLECVYVKHSQQVGSLDEITIQPGTRESSGQEYSLQSSALQTDHTELTPAPDPVSITSPLMLQPALHTQGQAKAALKSQGGMVTKSTTLNSREKDKPNTASEEVYQGRDPEPQPLKELSNSHSDISGKARDPWSSKGSIKAKSPSVVILQTNQHSVHQPSSKVKDGSKRNLVSAIDNVETTISSPDIQSEKNPKGAFSNGPQFAPTSTLISGSTTESGPVASGVHPSSEGVGEIREERQEPLSSVIASPFSADSTPSLKVLRASELASQEKEASEESAPKPTDLIPTLQSGEALNTSVMETEMSNVSATGIKEKEEMEDELKAVSPKAKTRQLPHGEQEGGIETDEDDVDFKLVEEGYRHKEMEEGSYDNDSDQLYNHSSSDLVPQFSGVNFIIQSGTEPPQQAVTAANQPSTHTVGHEATLRPGLRGQRVSQCLHFVVAMYE